MLDRVDHIVFCAPTLESGIDHISELTGIRATYGGRHLTKGTHNAIFKIGPHSYFEILAPDPENKDISAPRWMGIDLIKEPRITRWAIKSFAIEKEATILSNYRSDYGSAQSGSRALKDGSMLSWQLTDPLSKPAIEVVPFLLDWQDSIHPSTSLSDNCELKAIRLEHPDPDHIKEVTAPLNLDIIVTYAIQPKVVLTLKTPKGIIEIT